MNFTVQYVLRKDVSIATLLRKTVTDSPFKMISSLSSKYTVHDKDALFDHVRRVHIRWPFYSVSSYYTMHRSVIPLVFFMCNSYAGQSYTLPGGHHRLDKPLPPPQTSSWRLLRRGVGRQGTVFPPLGSVVS